MAITVDYRDFMSKSDATTTSRELQVRMLDEDELWGTDVFRSAAVVIGLDQSYLNSLQTWTIVILEDLKEKTSRLTHGRLRWILRTAMPLKTNFRLFLNGEEVESSKEDHTVLVQFNLGDLDSDRIKGLMKKTGETWSAKDSTLFSNSFPSGISGTAIVTQQTLGGKSLDLGRSGGFFVYVRGRLVNEEDDRFGLHVHTMGTFNRFRAEFSLMTWIVYSPLTGNLWRT